MNRKEREGRKGFLKISSRSLRSSRLVGGLRQPWPTLIKMGI